MTQEEIKEDNGGWIKVTDRLPEVANEKYWVFVHGRAEICRYIACRENVWVDEDEDYYSSNEVTHWQPIVLPEPPKE